jgi:hypothetical protein
VDPVWSIPTGVHQFVMIISLIKDNLNLHIATGRLILSIHLNYFSNNLAKELPGLSWPDHKPVKPRQL